MTHATGKDSTNVKGPDRKDRFVRVAVPVPIGRASLSGYDYLLPAGWQAVPGQLVKVPVGPRQLWGVVLDCPEEAEIDRSRLKAVLVLADLPPLPMQLLEFARRVAEWTLAPGGQLVRMLLSVPDALEPPARMTVLQRADRLPEQARLTQLRARVLDFMQNTPPLPAADLARETGASTASLTAMVKAGLLERQSVPRLDSLSLPDRLQAKELVLNDSQQEVANGIAESFGQFAVHLLDGVTGSGKTETYFDLVARQVNQGKQVLILLPEIALTTGWEDRFRRWFGLAPQIWHSGVTSARRRQLWKACLSGRPMVVVGARSALFLPFANLGLIVVDEEHDAAFKQEDQVIYQARDMAILRGRCEQLPVLLASATPSLESWVNAGKGRYRHWQLASRYGPAELPKIAAIDLRRHRPAAGFWLSAPLVEAMQQTIEAGEQVLLYLNRRGYAPMAICTDCGERLGCHQCDASLVTHRLAGQLRCHQCGFSQPLRPHCPSCQAENSLQLVGPGIERLAEEVISRFPEASFALMSSDLLARSDEAARIVRSIEAGEVNIIIGTQLVAKGHHFPKLTLVGVVDGDLGLGGGDLRAAERTWQMLAQVAGRAGRSDKPGRALIQTGQPDHPVMETLLAGRRNAFLQRESEMRQAAMMPPHGRLAAVILSATDQPAAESCAAQLAAAWPGWQQVQFYGPAAAPIAMVRGRYRIRFLISAPRAADLQQMLHLWLEKVKIPAKIHLQIDIDPYHFL
jgi:primosomal protein N' (replication factor Y)